MDTAAERITVNGTSYSVTSRGAGLIELAGARGGAHVLIKNIRSGRWAFLQGGRREVRIRTIDGLTAQELATPDQQQFAKAVAGEALVFEAPGPNHYTISARRLRAAGFKCAFRRGEVFVWVPGQTEGWVADIDSGRWMNHGHFGVPPWGYASLGLALPMRFIERDCYCSSFPDSGCDYCNGVRYCDGEAA